MHLKQMVRDLEERREEERRRREEGECEEGRVGGWEGVRETVRSALHLPPLSEEEYITLRGQERREEGGEGQERDTQSLTDYIRVSRNTQNLDIGKLVIDFICCTQEIKQSKRSHVHISHDAPNFFCPL